MAIATRILKPCVYLLVVLSCGVSFSQNDIEISTGGTYTISEKEFSILPPKGWEIHRGIEGVTLLLRAPFHKSEVYQRNIQVLSFPEPKFIDDLTMREFGNTIVENFQKHARGIQNFNLRDSMMIDLKNKSKGILYYTEFEATGRQMMQAHLLLSSQGTHFLVTFSDLRETFEDPSYAAQLKEAWDAIISVELSTPAPIRFDFKLLVFLILSLLLLGGLFLFYRRRMNNIPSDLQ